MVIENIGLASLSQDSLLSDITKFFCFSVLTTTFAQNMEENSLIKITSALTSVCS